MKGNLVLNEANLWYFLMYENVIIRICLYSFSLVLQDCDSDLNWCIAGILYGKYPK